MFGILCVICSFFLKLILIFSFLIEVVLEEARGILLYFLLFELLYCLDLVCVLLLELFDIYINI